VLVSSGSWAIEVRLLAYREAAVQIMWSGLHLHPCVIHDLLDVVSRSGAVAAAFLLPVVEDAAVERRHVLGSVGRKKETVMACEPRS